MRFAITHGFRAYGFSSHSPLPFETFWNMSKDDMPEYLQEIKRLKQKYSDQLEIYAGLEIDYLDGLPGVYSARYAPNRDFNEGMKMLLKEMSEAEKKTRKAHFACYMALACPNEKVKVFEGRVDGEISEQPRGDNGFGYDPIFIPEGYDKTFAELGDDVKNQISHRRRALEKFIKEFK